MADNFNDMPIRFMGEAEMENTRDWLSRLLEMIPVRRTAVVTVGRGRGHRVLFQFLSAGRGD
jgi:hypothetical protein